MVDREGHAFASMGLFATVKDAARFGELFRNGGRNLEGEQVVPEAWVAASSDYSAVTGGPRGYQWAPWSEGYYGRRASATSASPWPPASTWSGVRFGNDPVDSDRGEGVRGALPRRWPSLLGAGGPDDPVDPEDPGGSRVTRAIPMNPVTRSSPDAPAQPGTPERQRRQGKRRRRGIGTARPASRVSRPRRLGHGRRRRW